MDDAIEYEYGWEADEEIRETMSPRGPKIMIDGTIGIPEEISNFPKGRRIRRIKAGPWEHVDDET